MDLERKREWFRREPGSPGEPKEGGEKIDTVSVEESKSK